MDYRTEFLGLHENNQLLLDLWGTIENFFTGSTKVNNYCSYVRRALELIDGIEANCDKKSLKTAVWLNIISKNSVIDDRNLQEIASGTIALDVINNDETEEGRAFSDLKLFYLTMQGEKCWEAFLDSEIEKEKSIKSYEIFTEAKSILKKGLKQNRIFRSYYFQAQHGPLALENARLIYDRIKAVENYVAVPLKTAEIDLPLELNSLNEEMSENIHENWSALRLKQGWSYGLTRNDHKKSHPCLVPYNLLPEEEKDYDRQTAEQTLKFILSQNYQIVPPESNEPGAFLGNIQLEGLSVRNLLEVQQQLKSRRSAQPEDYYILGKEFQNRAEKVLAYETFQLGLKLIGGDEKSSLYRDMMFNAARTLADCYAYKEAEKLLRTLEKKGFQDGDIIGQLAKIRKIIAVKTGDSKSLKSALDFYKSGYEKALEEVEVAKEQSEKWYKSVNAAIYNGINTATMFFLQGKDKKCKKTVKKVLELCRSKSKDKTVYWDHATMGEASLLNGDLKQAKSYYTKAVENAPQGDVESMLAQVKIICQQGEIDTAWIDEVFVVPAAVIFSGHRIDRKGEKRFPAEDEGRVRKEISNYIEKNKPGFGYCSALPGSELIFIEEMISAGAEVHVCLPYEEERFLENYEGIPGIWKERFERVRNKITSITVTGTYDEGLNEANCQFTNKYMAGLAVLKSESSNCELKALALWDGVNRGGGGVSDAISIWKKSGIEYETIKTVDSKITKEKKTVNYPDTKVEESLCMLFADVKGYSKLAGEQLILFTKHFMGKSDKVISKYDDAVLVRRSQGDGLFIVFTSLQAAIDVSVGLKDMVLSTDWESLGLPGDLTARFALDTGPCYSFIDPIARQTDLSGAHVIRAARLEPVTPPGHIFASEGFAAVCAINKLQDHFELAGQVKLPKNYGEMRVYYLDKSLNKR